MATTTKTLELNRAFSVDARALSAIWSIVSSNGEKPLISFECSDNSKIKTDNLDTLLTFPNSDLRSISAIEFENSYPSKLRMELRFEGHLYRSKILPPKISLTNLQAKTRMYCTRASNWIR